MFRIREVFGVELRMAAFYEAPTLAACAAAIDTAQSAGQAAARAPRSAVAPSGIGRRDRSVYRVAAPKPRTGPASRARAASGAPDRRLGAVARRCACAALASRVHLLAARGATPTLPRAADAVLAEAASDPEARSEASGAYAAEFTAAVRQLSAALHEAASLPALREAVAWQNRHALTTGIDVLVRHGPEPDKRNGQHRQHEALVASYLQRYCAKNDTIGFFGPVGWSQIDDGAGIRITHVRIGKLPGRSRHLPGGLGSRRR